MAPGAEGHRPGPRPRSSTTRRPRSTSTSTHRLAREAPGRSRRSRGSAPAGADTEAAGRRPSTPTCPSPAPGRPLQRVGPPAQAGRRGPATARRRRRPRHHLDRHPLEPVARPSRDRGSVLDRWVKGTHAVPAHSHHKGNGTMADYQLFINGEYVDAQLGRDLHHLPTRPPARHRRGRQGRPRGRRPRPSRPPARRSTRARGRR